MSMQANIQESWSPEPELRDAPPRRLVNSSYDDYNRPNVMVGYAGGGGVLSAGIFLFFLGTTSWGILSVLSGIVLVIGGGAIIFLWQSKAGAHLSRAENLVTHGIPLPARVVASSNLTGDSVNGRALKYQITLPSGEMTHKDVNADERSLPPMIPATVTALFDPRTSDIELYCALPYRAVPRAVAAAATPDPLAALPGGTIATPIGTMGGGTIGGLTPLGDGGGGGGLRPMGSNGGGGGFASQTANPSTATVSTTTNVAEPPKPPVSDPKNLPSTDTTTPTPPPATPKQPSKPWE